MPVRGSPSYVWFTEQPLGAGASGSVFTGRHKREGKPCAVKVFHNNGRRQQTEMQEREFAAMRRLDHINIVRLIAIETETRGTDRVLVMELCSGGSVYKMLKEPENYFGFDEDEFLRFLRDITSALRYLRQCGMIHRDIKPGNILRSIDDKSRSVYKLTDFGAARELADEEGFTSLYGTEEYLHPDAFGRALLGQSASGPLDAGTDLWSLGATIYHVATGRLPFKSFAGRDNKGEMHKIISKKHFGVISGVQTSEGGSVEWSRNLPATCRLSRCLQKMLVPMLAGLLERDPLQQMSFETYFSQSQNITNKSHVFIFYPISSCHIRLYLRPDDTLSHLQDALASETDVPASSQLLLQNSERLENAVSSTAPISSYSAGASDDDPLIMLPMRPSTPSASAHDNVELPETPAILFHQTLATDAEAARKACAVATHLLWQMKRRVKAEKMIIKCTTHIRELILRERHYTQTTADILRLSNAQLPSLGCHVIQLCMQYECRNPVCSESLSDHIIVLRQRETKIKQHCGTGDLQPLSTLRLPKMAQMNYDSIGKVEAIIQDLNRMRLEFKQQERQKQLSYNEEQIHKFDVAKLKEGFEKVVVLYREHSSRHLTSVINVFTQWYRESVCVYMDDNIKRSKDFEIYNDVVMKTQTLIAECLSATIQKLNITKNSVTDAAIQVNSTCTLYHECCCSTCGRSMEVKSNPEYENHSLGCPVQNSLAEEKTMNNALDVTKRLQEQGPHSHSAHRMFLAGSRMHDMQFVRNEYEEVEKRSPCDADIYAATAYGNSHAHARPKHGVAENFKEQGLERNKLDLVHSAMASGRLLTAENDGQKSFKHVRKKVLDDTQKLSDSTWKLHTDLSSQSIVNSTQANALPPPYDLSNETIKGHVRLMFSDVKHDVTNNTTSFTHENGIRNLLLRELLMPWKVSVDDFKNALLINFELQQRLCEVAARHEEI